MLAWSARGMGLGYDSVVLFSMSSLGFIPALKKEKQNIQTKDLHGYVLSQTNRDKVIIEFNQILKYCIQGTDKSWASPRPPPDCVNKFPFNTVANTVFICVHSGVLAGAQSSDQPEALVSCQAKPMKTSMAGGKGLGRPGCQPCAVHTPASASLKSYILLNTCLFFSQ